MPKGFPIGFKMAEKKVNRQTDRQTNRYFRISRDEIKIDLYFIGKQEGSKIVYFEPV